MSTAEHGTGSPDGPVRLPQRKEPHGDASAYRVLAGERPAGYAALLQRHGLTTCHPPHLSYLHPKAFGARSREEANHGRGIREVFPGRTAVGDSDADHLSFAMRYDGVDLETLRQVMPRIDPSSLIAAITATPNSTFVRRSWFLYEWITGQTLPIQGIEKLRLSATPLLDPDEHITRDQGISHRHGVRVNVLGSNTWCPQIRRTATVESALQDGPLALRNRIRSELSDNDAKRINQFLVTEETWASFAIEGERPTAERSQRFYSLLQLATAHPAPELTESFLSEAQRELMENPTYKDGRYRGESVWIGHREQSIGGIKAKVSYIAPKYEDVPALMEAFLPVANQLVALTEIGGMNPIISASLISSGFVYIHPYVDGNGRLSRLLLQHALSAGDPYQNQRILIPASAAIERDKALYYDTLSMVSRQVMTGIRYDIDERGQVVVANDTKNLYRYPDLTDMTAYLGRTVRSAVEHDLVEEQRILSIYDRAHPELDRIGHLPPKDLDLFFRVCKQNNWALSARKRERFGSLTDEQVVQMETVLRNASHA